MFAGSDPVLPFPFKITTSMSTQAVDTTIIKTPVKVQQPPKNLSAQRHAIYVGNSLRSDLKFLIQKDNIEIPAHSFVIGVASPTLKALVEGSGNLTPTDVKSTITVTTNITAKEFMVILTYLYTDKWDDINVNNAIPIMHTAEYYLIDDLVKICVNFLTAAISTETVCDFFEQTYLLANKFSKKCLKFISENTMALLENNKLMDLNVEPLKEVFSLPSLSVSREIKLFEAMILWSIQTCEKNAVPVTRENKLMFLDGRLELIQFDLMSEIEFFNCLKIDAEVLSEAEVGKLVCKFATRSQIANAPKSPFAIAEIPKPRASLFVNKNTTIDTDYSIYRRLNTIDFTSWPLISENCTISVRYAYYSLRGIGVIGDNFNIHEKSANSPIKYTQKTFDPVNNITSVIFEKPIELSQSNSFSLCVKYVNSGFSYKCCYVLKDEQKQNSIYFNEELLPYTRIVECYFSASTKERPLAVANRKLSTSITKKDH